MKILNSLLVLVSLASQVLSQDDTVQFHGSGTSNPDRCYWHVLETLEAQTKIPIRATYRSTSSGPGLTEFIGNVTNSFTHFASADYPMPQEDYNTLKENGVDIIQLPVLMGAIGVFHSVPLQRAESGDQLNLNLTSCMVARIFKQDITDWNHADIVEINPSMDIPVKVDAYGNPLEDQEFPIRISHRTLGSSSTFAFTKYLHKSCPEHWGEDLVGSQITWPTGANVVPAQGTAAMLANIKDELGTIGYADAGFALDEGIAEVGLKMDNVALKEPFYLTAENSLSKGGILATLSAAGAGIPDSSDADWSGVDLINQIEGYIYTWPMVLMTYIFVRKDLPSFLPDPRAQSLLIAFLKSLYDPLYVQQCETEFQFVTVTGDLRDMALEGIAMLQTSPDAPQWVVEGSSILTEGGQGDYVISSHRSRSSAIQQEILSGRVTEAEETLDMVLQEIEELQGQSPDTDDDPVDVPGGEGLSDDDERRLNAAFVMGIISLILWPVSLAVMFMQQSKLKALENAAAVAPNNRRRSNGSRASKPSNSILNNGHDDEQA